MLDVRQQKNIRALALIAMALVTVPLAPALAEGGSVKIGVLTDMSGAYADAAGQGSVVAAELAVEDVGGTVLGKPVEIASADHQNRPEVGANIARR